MIEQETIPCITCGKPTTFLGTKLCDPCHRIQSALASYLNNKHAIQFVLEALNKVTIKPLAEYLAIVSDMERPKTQAFFQEALDAYQSTENVTIKIERV